MLAGFNPDPSIVRAEGAYYLVTSTFEYLPGIPVYRSNDLVGWTQIGNVATRPEQVDLHDVPTPGGVWAPTIRYRDGVFHVIVTVMLGGRGCVLFTASDPAGPWSDGTTIPAVDGIDPDLAWGDDGTAYVTYARYPDAIWQVRVDLATGGALEEPRPLWAGSGLYAPEGPHLYSRGETWYLLVAEGGTDRGHAVSVARGPSPSGPFDGCPANPVLSARSSGSAVQNLGHADLVETPDGATALVLLGVRPLGLARAFSPLGRETFGTDVDWVDGWPYPRPVQLSPSSSVGGLAARHDENHWFGLEVRDDGAAATVTARAVLAGLDRNWQCALPAGEVDLRIEASAPPSHFSAGVVGGDRIRLVAVGGGQQVVLAELDGRYWSFEVAKSFTGRVVGLFAVDGTVTFADVRYLRG